MRNIRRTISEEELVRAGLTNQQARSQAVQKIFELIATDQIDGADALKVWIEKAANELCGLQFSARETLDELKEAHGNLKNAAKLIDDNGAYRFDRCRTNEDKMLLMFRSILETAKEVFGEEKMTEAVICQIVTNASYAAWRTAPAQWVGEMNGKWKKMSD